MLNTPPCRGTHTHATNLIHYLTKAFAHFHYPDLPGLWWHDFEASIPCYVVFHSTILYVFAVLLFALFNMNVYPVNHPLTFCFVACPLWVTVWKLRPWKSKHIWCKQASIFFVSTTIQTAMALQKTVMNTMFRQSPNSSALDVLFIYLRAEEIGEC